MKTSERLYSLALASAVLILFLILISSTAAAATAQSASPTITETRITTSGLAGIPAIYGDRIVWDDWRNKELSQKYNGNTDIYMHNLSTHKEIQITTSGSAVFPAIYGDRILWSDNRSGNRDIYMYDLSTSKESQISANGADQTWPDIYGNNIVWQDDRNRGSDIYMYNLSTHKENRITTSGSAVFPAIYGDRIVWSGNRSGNWNIYMYNLSTSKETQISASGSAAYPAIYGDRIVWSDYRDGSGDIYMYNLSTSKETQVSKNESACNPAIYGDMVVWANTLNGNSNIYMYNLSTHQESHTTDGSYQYYPAIYGNRIVCTDGRSGNFDIYMATLNYHPVAAFSASPISGITPLNVTFTDISTGTPTAWNWSFGDKTYSTIKNPVHRYSAAGNYTVALTATNGAGSNTTTKSAYIRMTETAQKQVASFSSNITSGNVPLNVLFTDTSTGFPTSWNWNFGDGTYSTARNPVHPYSKVGKYTVNLTVKNAVGSNTVTKSGYVVVNALKAPIAAFSASSTSGNVPLKVQFTDKSTGSPTSWKWSFGDGAYSTARNPAHTYSKVGKYTVSLTVKNAAVSNAVTKSSYINVVTLKAPVAAFSASSTSGNVPLKVQFTDKSLNSPTSWKWSFGDGTYSTSKSPAHTYSKVGKYTVSLTLKNAAGSNAMTKSSYVNVVTLKPPIAAFSASTVSGKVPLTVTFYDKSIGSPASWKWSFGDGTYSTSKNPVHKYSKAGKYTVSLTAKNAKGSNSVTKSGYIILK
ncbi:MAG: PKD domain-containing protein [Methanosarcina sp.]